MASWHSKQSKPEGHISEAQLLFVAVDYFACPIWVLVKAMTS